jgi:hypothetical protein
MSIIQGTSKAAGGAVYEIDQSIRFNQADSARLTRTPASAGNRKTFTFSCWLKRGKLSTIAARIFTGYQDVNNQFEVYFNASDKLIVAQRMSGTWYERATSTLYRDPSAWYHFVWYWDTTDGTAENRMRAYINGERVTFASGSNPSLNADGMVNATIQHEIAGEQAGSTYYYDGYLSEIHFIDGTALDPTSFGEYNDDGVWIPKAYDGSYGTNGFYITGETASDLGEDFSGNGNDFTSSGLATTDQMSDTPTLNASTFNPLWAGAGLSDGNLVATASGNSYQWAVSTFAVDDGGKYVCELQKSSGTFGYIGLYQMGNHNVTSGNNYGYFYNLGTGEIVKNGSVVTDLGTGAANSLMRLEYNSATDTLEFFDDGSSIYSATTGLTGQNSLHFGCAPFGSGTVITATFQGLSGTPTADFLELTSATLPTPSITDGSAHFNPVLFTGNSGTAFSVTGVGFQPDFVWGKPRSLADNHRLMDVVRGSTEQLISNATNAEFTQTQGITSFDSDGFTVGTHNGLNTGTNTYVAWCWLADNTTGSSNTDGATTSTVSASATSGFSIVKWTGTGANTTLGHGLGVAPQMILVKNLADADSWVVYHEDVGATKGLTLDTTATPVTASTFFNNTAPTSSVFSVGGGGRTNGSSDAMIAYCFAEISGYSSFGSYTGNGSTNGPFVYTGFSPKYILYKRTSGGTGNWDILDTERDPINVSDAVLAADKTTAETTYSTIKIDILSNGYKIRGTQTNLNASGSTYIYMAFAENPFGGDGVAPATAR